jgi:hypothetical protein
MVISNYGKSGNTLQWCGSSLPPRYAAIGSGSGADVASLGSLVAEVLAQRTDFTSRDISTSQQMDFTFDFSSVTMSGINLREFGIGGSQAKSTNDLWLREAFDAITFDGTNELQLQITLRST